MSEVEFEENQFMPKRPDQYRKNQNNKGIIGLVMSSGMAKNKTQANIILLGVIIVCIIATILVAVTHANSNTQKAVPYEAIHS